MKTFKFKYRSLLESEGAAYEDAKRTLQMAGLESKRMFRILLALSEAFTNALVHGNQFNSDKYVFVNITVNDSGITADIIDEGVGFDTPEGVAPFDDLQAESGRGMGLMKSIADRFQLRKSPETGGTVISMFFAAAPAADRPPKKDNMEDKMDTVKKDEGNVVVLSLSGRLDLGSGNKLKEEVKSILAGGRNAIHLNLRNVEFVNSSGLGALVSIMKEIRIHRGRLTLSDMADYVREIFDITQLSHIFEIFATEQEAINSYTLVVNS
jgi:anti-anti-sigma factor